MNEYPHLYNDNQLDEVYSKQGDAEDGESDLEDHYSQKSKKSNKSYYEGSQSI